MKKQTSPYKSLAEFRIAQPKAYNFAFRNNLLEKLCEDFGWKQRISWTLELCKKEAKKYQTRTEWQKQSPSYQTALKNGWLNECCKHMYTPKPYNFKWSLDNCIKEAKKYKTRTEFNKKSSGAYDAALRNKWLNKCCKHMVSGNKLRWNNAT